MNSYAEPISNAPHFRGLSYEYEVKIPSARGGIYMLGAANFIYGTAWKKEDTAQLVSDAIVAGFTSFDTANQKKHYREDYMGEALKEQFDKGLDRKTLFIQSKFTHIGGQDHRLPYNPEDSFTEQTLSSFNSSLKNLHTDYLDSYLIHGPLYQDRVGDEDLEIWQTMEGLAGQGKVKNIGLSNVSINYLKQFYEQAKVKPTFVQNRCYANRAWDHDVHSFCLEHDITYQGFSLLTANQEVWNSEKVSELATKYNVTSADVIFKFAKQIKMLPLTGTTNVKRMKSNLNNIETFELSSDEVNLIKNFLI